MRQVIQFNIFIT